MEIWGRPDLTGPAVLDYRGRMQLPLIGEIDAGGRTPGDLGKYLTERYQLLDPAMPEVLITVTEYNNRSISVVGEVRGPGRFRFREIPDLWAVILAAGGPTPNADLARVEVVHKEPPAGTAKTVIVDLSKGIEKTPAGSLPSLLPQDTVMLPSLAANEVSGDRIQILGAVRTPGLYRLTAAGTILEAIALSGGPLPDANLDKVRVTRPSDNGVISYELNIHEYLYDARACGALELRGGDTVTVPSQRSFLGSILEGFLRAAPFISVASTAAGVILALQRS